MIGRAKAEAYYKQWTEGRKRLAKRDRSSEEKAKRAVAHAYYLARKAQSSSEEKTAADAFEVAADAWEEAGDQASAEFYRSQARWLFPRPSSTQGRTKLDRLRASLPSGWTVHTWSPGDGKTRYRFFWRAPSNQTYFGPDSGRFTVLGYGNAKDLAGRLNRTGGLR